MIAIIGAGISGLTLAYELQKLKVDYILIEKDKSPGGYIKTEKINDYIIEKGPNSIFADDKTMDFIKELQLDNQVQLPSSFGSKRYILKNGKPKKLPTNPIAFFFGDFFSWKSKMSILKELRLEPQQNVNESLGDLFERRFNKEIVDYGLNPFVSGIFAGDPYKILVSQSFPFLADFEKNYGSILKGFLKTRKKKGKRIGITFKQGMSVLPEKISAKLTNVKYGVCIRSIEKSSSGYIIKGDSNGEAFRCNPGQIVITTPASIAGAILKKEYPEFAETLNTIDYPPLVKVFFAFKKHDIPFPLQGYGILNPTKENRFLLGTIWTSSIYPGVCPKDEVLFTTMIGGALGRTNCNLDENLIIDKALKEIKENYGIQKSPVFSYIQKIAKSIPQYDINILKIHKKMEGLQRDNIFFCVNWKDSASIADCIKKAKSLSSFLYNSTSEMKI